MSSAFEKGRDDGRNDRDPKTENYSPLANFLLPDNDPDSVKERNEDYQAGYQAGSNQRAADKE